MIQVERLGPDDVAAMEEANRLFALVFAEEAYHGPPAGRDHLAKVLSDPKFVALVARVDGTMVGALAGYELVKFEAERSEFYIYDLAVIEAHRRRGVATALIEAMKGVAREGNGWMVFVQADHRDQPAIALYEKLGRREEVIHFDIYSGDQPKAG